MHHYPGAFLTTTLHCCARVFLTRVSFTGLACVGDCARSHSAWFSNCSPSKTRKCRSFALLLQRSFRATGAGRQYGTRASATLNYTESEVVVEVNVRRPHQHTPRRIFLYSGVGGKFRLNIYQSAVAAAVATIRDDDIVKMSTWCV